jgi:RNA polymerase sigma-70 factor (ECF subfamily)
MRQGNPVLILSLLDTTGLERAAVSPLEDEVARLFAQLRAPLLRYLLALGLAPHDGEEVAQEVFLALFQHLRRGKPRTNLRAWVFRVGHNQALKLRARLQRSVELSGGGEAQQDPAPNPEQQRASAQRQQRLLSAVKAMPPQDRACIHLRAEGLRYREIAGVLGISLGAVAQSLERALARLQRMEER